MLITLRLAWEAVAASLSSESSCWGAGVPWQKWNRETTDIETATSRSVSQSSSPIMLSPCPACNYPAISTYLHPEPDVMRYKDTCKLYLSPQLH